MCNIPVNLPTLASFLMLYSLRCGCLVVWAWTLLRSMFYLVFFLVIVLMMYMPDPKPEYIESRPHDTYFFCVFICFVTMMITECFVIMFTVYLAVGLYTDSAYRVEQYLIGRFCAMLAEITTLVILIFHHRYFLGWYLVFLMVIILEIYSFIVVYSYYVDILEEQKAKECANAVQHHSEYDDYVNFDCAPECQDLQETNMRMQPSRNSRASRQSRCSRNCPDRRYLPEPQYMPEPRYMPETRNMPEPQYMPEARNMPEPRNMTGSRNMPMPLNMTGPPQELRSGFNVRSRPAREKMMADFRDGQCVRDMQDPKYCLCVGYKTPPY